MSSGSYAVFISFVSPVLFFLQPFEGRRRRKVWLKNRQHGGRLVAILASRLRGPLYIIPFLKDLVGALHSKDMILQGFHCFWDFAKLCL